MKGIQTRYEIRLLCKDDSSVIILDHVHTVEEAEAIILEEVDREKYYKATILRVVTTFIEEKLL